MQKERHRQRQWERQRGRKAKGKAKGKAKAKKEKRPDPKTGVSDNAKTVAETNPIAKTETCNKSDVGRILNPHRVLKMLEENISNVTEPTVQQSLRSLVAQCPSSSAPGHLRCLFLQHVNAAAVHLGKALAYAGSEAVDDDIGSSGSSSSSDSD